MSKFGLDRFGDVAIGEHFYWFGDVEKLPPSLKNGDYKINLPKNGAPSGLEERK